MQLIDCQINGNRSSIFAEILLRWPQRLTLKGVEIVGLRFPSEPNFPSVSLEMWTNACECGYATTLQYGANGIHPNTSCPLRRKEWENAILGGRQNDIITRLSRLDVSVDKLGQWTTAPIYLM